MRIYTNASAFSVWKNYNRSVGALSKSMQKLSSGLQIVRPSDDPAGLAISEKFRAQIKNSAMAANNIENKISWIQTADGWLQTVHDILGRMGELAVEAHDGTKTNADRQNLQLEFNGLGAEITQIVTVKARYNTALMLNGGNALQVQVGPDAGQVFTETAFDVDGLGGIASAIGGSVSTQTGASTMIAAVNTGVVNLAGTRATLGAEESRLEHTVEGLRNYEENITAAESRIRNVDVAKETTNFSKNQILVQAGTAMLAQANAMPQNVLALLNG